MNLYSEIKKDDLVITRLKNGKYYIGRVETEATYSDGTDLEALDKKSKSDGFSWCCKVHKWYEYTESELPIDIVGRFSQRYHSTIQNIANDRIKLLLISTYQKKAKKKYRYTDINIPKILLNKENFATALNYMDLEDLVYLYILNKEEKNYRLLPSQCKISKVKYEFNLFNKDDITDKITCQVKNQGIVFLNDYKKDADEKEFTKIYLFSGIGQYGKKEDIISDEDKKFPGEDWAEEKIKEWNLENRIEIIKKDDLYV